MRDGTRWEKMEARGNPNCGSKNRESFDGNTSSCKVEIGRDFLLRNIYARNIYEKLYGIRRALGNLVEDIFMSLFAHRTWKFIADLSIDIILWC